MSYSDAFFLGEPGCHELVPIFLNSVSVCNVNQRWRMRFRCEGRVGKTNPFCSGIGALCRTCYHLIDWMNGKLVHGELGLSPARLLLLLRLQSLVEQAILGHSRVHHEHSAVTSKGNSFRHMELCPSAMHAYYSWLPMYLMKDIVWDPIKDIKKFDEFYLSKKLAILVELWHLENQIIIIIIIMIKFSRTNENHWVPHQPCHPLF